MKTKGNQGSVVRLSSLEALKTLEGRYVEADYPAQNVWGVPLRFEHRRFQVKRVRRFGEDPKDLAAAAKNPMVRRIGLLMLCVDVDKGEPRTFYSGAMKGLRVLSDDEAKAVVQRGRGRVFIIDRPLNWEPTSTDAIPPNVERCDEPDHVCALIFARRFNELELASPDGESTGKWAVA